MWIAGGVYGDPLCYSCNFSITLTLCQSQKLNRKKKEENLFGFFSLKKLFSLKELIQMVASLASLDSSLAISVKMPIFQKQAEILLMRTSFPSHAMQVVLPDHQSFLSGSLTISTGYFCIVPSLNLQHSSPPPCRLARAEAQGRSFWNWKMEISDCLRGNSKSWDWERMGRKPTGLCWGRDPHAYLDPGQESSQDKVRPWILCPVSCWQRDLSWNKQSGEGAGKTPSAGVTQD